MRTLTVRERRYVYRGYRCCFCGDVLVEGPRGGASVNMDSPFCGARFALIHREYQERYGEGILFFAELLTSPFKPYTQIDLDPPRLSRSDDSKPNPDR